MIVTAILDKNIQNELNYLRSKYFPTERNYLDAHITLFHACPDRFLRDIKEIYSVEKAFDFRLINPFFLGFGFAVEVDSIELRDIYLNLRNKFYDSLTAQDQRDKKLHVTIQNKVSGRDAKADFSKFKSTWCEINGSILGLSFYEYLDGPWRKIEDFYFG